MQKCVCKVHQPTLLGVVSYDAKFWFCSFVQTRKNSVLRRYTIHFLKQDDMMHFIIMQSTRISHWSLDVITVICELKTYLSGTTSWESQLTKDTQKLAFHLVLTYRKMDLKNLIVEVFKLKEIQDELFEEIKLLSKRGLFKQVSCLLWLIYISQVWCTVVIYKFVVVCRHCGVHLPWSYFPLTFMTF